MSLPQQEDKNKRRPVWHWLIRYGLAVVLFAATIGLSISLNYFELKINLTIPVLLSVVVAAWFGGLGPGILISLLFQTTTIIYSKIPPDSSLARVAFTYFSVFTLYIFLSVIVSRLKQIQAGLREQRDLLQVTLSSIGDAVIATNIGGNITFMNPAAEKLTGFISDEAVGLPLTGVVKIINEETRDQVSNPVEKVMETGTVVGLANHSVLVAKDGNEVPIDDSAAPIKDNGEIKGVILVIADVTQRKLAERSKREREMMSGVVEAQEAERRRIARDLHDHLGQRMTGLRLKLEALTDKCGGSVELVEAVEDVKWAAAEIDGDIGYLSWELRPTELENLGLADALKSFVREWSRQYNLSADFQASKTDSQNGGPRLPESVETNLYRIVQEGLNNVLKHAKAKHTSVLLQYQKDAVTLIIEDDGHGFDPYAARNGSGPSGLGLVGMKERASIMNGTFELDSEVGSGTTVVVRVPVAAFSPTASAAASH